MEILNRLLELSALQRRFICEKRIDELIRSQEERNILFTMFRDPGPERSNPALKALADKLSESDRLLAEEVGMVLDSIGARLGQLRSGMAAVKAYNKAG